MVELYAIVLNKMLAALQGEPVHYWPDKAGHEVDFILARRGRPPLAIECKWSASDVSVENLRAFRHRYPEGENVVVAQDVDRYFAPTLSGLRLTVENLPGLITRLGREPLARGRQGGRASRRPTLSSFRSFPTPDDLEQHAPHLATRDSLAAIARGIVHTRIVSEPTSTPQ